MAFHGSSSNNCSAWLLLVWPINCQKCPKQLCFKQKCVSNKKPLFCGNQVQFFSLYKTQPSTTSTIHLSFTCPLSHLSIDYFCVTQLSLQTCQATVRFVIFSFLKKTLPALLPYSQLLSLPPLLASCFCSELLSLPCLAALRLLTGVGAALPEANNSSSSPTPS